MPKKKKLNSDDFLLTNDVNIDLSGYGAACETLSITPLDTITISDLDTGTFDMSTITSSANYGTITTTTGGYSTGPVWTTTGTGSGGGYTFANIPNPLTGVDINTKGIDIRDGGDIRIDGKSLKTFMDKMEQRLAILVPDPEKLEKFEALKKAYEHYKTMESLCFPEKEDAK